VNTPRSTSTGRSNRPASGVSSRPTSARRKDDKPVDGRVRVAVRLRPVLPAEEAEVGDRAATIEVESEVKRVLVKRDLWDCDSYQYDNAFPGTSSQRRLYEEFCSPVVESVVKGYNGTIMAYGQTGTGKTHTLGNLGHEDASQRGIVVRAMEHVLNTVTEDTAGQYKISLSYLQLYMECVLDLLEPTKEQLQISEDPVTGEVYCAGAKVVEVNDLEGLLTILKIGEDHRVVANQRLNATSSRSHSLLIINIRRLPKQTAEMGLTESVTATKGKLLIVDLAGSERIAKSGSEGQMLEEAKFINLSLTALGKCINTIAEGNPSHIPYRDSKLTRMLKDSFGGTARTSLIVCISPLRSHISETSSALQFGQRAIKIENTTKIREEVDLKLLNYRLQAELDRTNNLYEQAVSSMQRLAKEAMQDKKKMEEAQAKCLEAEHQVQAEKVIQEKIVAQYRQMMADSEMKLRAEADEKVSMERGLKKTVEAQLLQVEEERAREQEVAKQAAAKQDRDQAMTAQQLAQTQTLLQELRTTNAKEAEEHSRQVSAKEALVRQLQDAMAAGESSAAAAAAKEAVLADARGEAAKLAQDYRILLQEKDVLAHENIRLTSQLAAHPATLPTPSQDPEPETHRARSVRHSRRGNSDINNQETLSQGFAVGEDGNTAPKGQWTQHRDAVSAVSKLFEHVGLSTVFGLLKYDDRDVRLHAVKVIANLAAEEENQVNIVQEGGLEALFDLLQSCTDEMTLRVAAGAIANLAMSEANQNRIVQDGGLELLVKLSLSAQDSQTQRMIAGAIANLCGNANILDKLQNSGSLRMLVELSNSEHVDVLSQVARGFANNSKCTKGKTNLIELGALPAILHLASKTSLTTVRKHAMLALCQIASCAANVDQVRSSGALQMLTEIANSQWDEFKQMAATVVSNPIYQCTK